MIQRLAHAHHHDVGQQTAVGGVVADISIIAKAIHPAARPFAQSIASEHHLTHDLAGGEIAHEAHGAGVAESAVQCAADLA